MRDSSESAERIAAPGGAQLTAGLLAWYDAHAREMPWRISPARRALGERPDPYRIWLSEVMLQQTTVAAVRAYFLRFTSRWPDVQALAAAPDEEVMAEWAGLGYYARARNLLKCAREVASRGGFPESCAGLLSLPGVGPYTAAAVASIAFDEPAVVVDGNVERVMSRMFAVETPLPRAKPELTALAAALTPQERAGDYAQAVMDLGATICTPRSPACAICPWMGPCKARALGIAASLPRKEPKASKPLREGRVWLLKSSRGWLIERRAAKGLLGGMPGLPGDDWDQTALQRGREPAAGADVDPASFAPAGAPWREAGRVRHTFTHFHLELQVFVAEAEANPDRGEFIPAGVFDPASLPTVFRKAFDLGAQALEGR